MSYEDTINNFNKSNVTVEEIEKLVEQTVKGLPVMDRAALRKEMLQMTVSVSENPTTFDINEGLAKSQAYRDRLSQIYSEALIDQKIRKRCLDMLFDVTNIVSKASSADKRKGEATLKYPMQILQFEISDAFLKEVEQVKINMENNFNTFSRQGSILQLQVQLGEYKSNKNTPFNTVQDVMPKFETGGAEEFEWV